MKISSDFLFNICTYIELCVVIYRQSFSNVYHTDIFRKTKGNV